MTEPARRGLRGMKLQQLALPGLVLLLLLALVLPTPAAVGEAVTDTPAVRLVDEALGELPDEPLVLVAFDADLGTYAEIRPATRVLIGELLARPSFLVVMSYTPEGRALAVEELGRLQAANANLSRVLDLGFVPGAEAALVASVRQVLPDGARGRVADVLRRREAGLGLAEFDAVVVVGGNDLGPRTWVEQVGTRLPEARLIAIAPTFQQPELAPYVGSGQLVALLGTTADSSAYVRRAGAEQVALAGDRQPATLALLVGMLVALATLLRAAGATTVEGIRARLGRGR